MVRQAFDACAAPDHEHDSAWVVRGRTAGPHHGHAVFHVHPTTTTGGWFGDPGDESDRREVDTVVRSQTAPFDGQAWSPRYRQASTRAFHEREAGGEEAYDLAYGDVSAAFAQFLADDAATPGPARPLVLVGHSQGARHVRSLLAEFFDHDGLADRLVAAYVIGIGVAPDDPVLDEFPLARTPTDHGVVVAYQARLAGTGTGTESEEPTACVDPTALAIPEDQRITRVGGHLCLPESVVGDHARRALPDGRLHHVEVEVLGDVLAADLRRRVAAWRSARPLRATVTEPWHVVDLHGSGSGSGSDPQDGGGPLVLLHKLGGWAAEWQAVASELATERRVLVVDLPGHGDSVRTGASPWVVWPRTTAEGLAAELRRRGVGPAHFMGCSLGGVVALLHAVQDPGAVRSLALVGTSLTQRFTAARTLEVDRAVRPGFDRGWVPRAGQNARARTDDVQVLADQDASRARAGRWIRPSERGVGLTGVQHLLGRVDVPTLYLNGEHAGYRSYEEVARERIRDVRVEVVPEAGSFPHQERPGEVVSRWRTYVAALR